MQTARSGRPGFVFGALFSLLAAQAWGDVVADWADTATEIATDGPNTTHTMALTQSAVLLAVNTLTQRYPEPRLADAGTASAPEPTTLAAAVAAASRAVLLHEAPALAARIETAAQATLASLTDDAARQRGIDVGERAAAEVLARHAEDLGHPEPYRPVTQPGVYVPTTTLLGVAVAQQRPWFLSRADALRPGPPPALNSAQYARDYNEVKDYGSAMSTLRSAEQTEAVRFWATALPDVHLGVVRSVADMPGRDLTRNARLYAAATAAMNEAEIAVFEAKYHYNFWRPITAIRNGDRDGNDATVRDPGWGPAINTPLQPEYPCGHCILAATLSHIILIEAGDGPLPLASRSNTAPGVVRHWSHPQEFEAEVSNARVWAGVHFRTSTEVGNRMGEQVARAVADGMHLR